jgi:hypothetical protein
MLNRLEEDHSALGDLLEEHRQAEEHVVLAAFVEQGGDPNDRRIVRMLTEHLRLRAGDGSLVEAHERFEEEVVFPFIRSLLPADRPRPRFEPLSHDLVLEPPGTSAPPRRAALKHVHAVAAPLVDVHGITLVVTSVEVWVDVVIVRIGGLPSEESDRRIAAAEAARREWSPGSGEEPPTPWDDFRGLQIAVRDDVDTPYRIRSGQTGGTGTEWHMEWRFAPAPPEDAETLYVTAGLGGEPPGFEVPIEIV